MLEVSSFFYYMWNAWCEEECAIAFKDASCGWHHIWNKWCEACSRAGGPMGAAERLFAELSDSNQELLVKRALELYEGRSKKY